jgi:Flp pilus assembly secretin CpaC
MRFGSPPSLRPITIFSVAAAAAMALFAGAQTVRAETLVVSLDHSTRLKIAGAAQSVVVGNPTVADVTVVDSHTLFVSGRGYGVTDVVVLDASGRTLYSTEVVVGVAHTGRVSVFRGAERTDMACSPNCQVSVRTGGAGGSSGGSTAPSSPGLSLPGAAGGPATE